MEPYFALYHDRNRSAARVRNVILRGSWPETLTPEQMARPTLAGKAPSSPKVHRASHALIGEQVFMENAAHVLADTQGLPPEKRYAQLLAWVLPNDQHPTFSTSRLVCSS